MRGGVGVSGADVLVLQGFELLLGAEFVGLGGEMSVRTKFIGWGHTYHVRCFLCSRRCFVRSVACEGKMRWYGSM